MRKSVHISTVVGLHCAAISALFFIQGCCGTTPKQVAPIQNMPTQAAPIEKEMPPAPKASTETSATICDIPAGTYQIGDALDKLSDAKPVHKVTLKAFKMDKYEVSKGLWDEVQNWANDQGYKFPNPACGYKYELRLLTTHPVHSLDWYDMVKWCNARSEKEGLTPVYYTDSAHKKVYKSGASNLNNKNVKWDANGYRLPTEAEWEAAARGGLAGKRYPWGDEIKGEYANYKNSGDAHEHGNMGGGNPITFSTPVGHYKGKQDPEGKDMANGYGLYDMCGNVWEFCWDRYGRKYYKDSPEADPHGADAGGTKRVARGGSWNDKDKDGTLGCAFRLALPPGMSGRHIGFRSVRSASP